MDGAIDAGGQLADLRRAIASIEGRVDPSLLLVSPDGGLVAGISSVTAKSGGETGDVVTSRGPAPEGRVADCAARLGGGEGERVRGGLSFGVATIDRRLGAAGGLMLGALHEISGDEGRDVGAVTGFAAALVARLLDRRSGRVLWISTAEARREGGGLHAPGVQAFGLDPGRVVEVAAERPEEALWACEEGLACGGTTAVIGEVPGRPAALDLTATRRLALRASRGGDGSDGRALALLLRVGGPAQTTAAATRWRVTAGPSGVVAGFVPGLGRPRFHLELEKNRDGRPGRFVLEWDPHDRCFTALAPHSGSASAASGDRPAASAGGGRVLAFDRALRR